MRLFSVLTLLLVLSLDVRADFIRETTFEDRIVCEADNKGVWREFGDACTDDCDSKFDQFKICDRAIRFSCDCGIGRCWKDKKCIFISKYKKTYESKFIQESEKISEAKKEREGESKENSAMITEKLIEATKGRAMSIDIEGAVNNYSDVYGEFIDDIKNSEAMQNASGAIDEAQKKAKKESEELPPIPVAPPIIIDSSNAQPTPTFTQQEKSKNQNNPQNKIEGTLEGLPLIPLPQSN